MKQTAVEWLEQNMPNISKHIPLGIALEFTAKFQLAKEMEEQQIIDAYIHESDYINPSSIEAKEYYKETYKTDL